MKIILLIYTAFTLCHQIQEFTVIAESGLNLRESNSLNSKVLARMPFGSIVELNYDDLMNYEEKSLKDTIEGKIGYWLKLRFKSNDEEIEGYGFSPYLRVGRLDIKLPSEKPIRIINEGFNCEELDYFPDLDWYGIYKVDSTYEIRSIDALLRLGIWNEETLTIDYELIDHPLYPIIETNIKDYSQFLIGVSSLKEIEVGVVEMLSVSNEIGYTKSPANGFLSVGEQIEVKFRQNKYRFEGIVNVKTGQEGEVIRTYDILVSHQDNFGNKIDQYISQDLSFYRPPEDHDFFQTPQIEWVGDLNKDGLLDFMIHQHTMTHTCGVCRVKTLYMGELDDFGVKSFRMIDDFVDCGCDYY